MVTKTRPITLTELVDQFIESVSLVSPRTGKRLSPWTVENYRKVLTGLEYFAAMNGWPEPARLTRKHLRDFVLYLSLEPRRWSGNGRRPTHKEAKTGTVNRYGTVTKTFFRWALEEEYLPETPELLSMLRFKLPQPGSDGVEPYTDDELTSMLGVCDYDIQRGNRFLGVRNKAIISVFTDTGLRLAELTGMKLSAAGEGFRQGGEVPGGALERAGPQGPQNLPGRLPAAGTIRRGLADR